jgi:hypothetical protein
MAESEALTELQREVLRLFFALPESAGFLLTGGAALLATGLSERPSADVDLFSSELAAGVGPAVDAFVAACQRPGWNVVVIRDAATFCRLHVSAPIGEVLVDLAVDSPPTGPPFVTSLAPTYPLRELAARKALALFDRAAARDFADLLSLSRHFDVDAILTDAADLDPGFDRAVFAQMLDTIERFTDDELRATSADSGELRQFTAALARRLRA